MPKSMSRRAPSWASNMIVLAGFVSLGQVQAGVADIGGKELGVLLRSHAHISSTLTGCLAVDANHGEVLAIDDVSQARS